MLISTVYLQTHNFVAGLKQPTGTCYPTATRFSYTKSQSIYKYISLIPTVRCPDTTRCHLLTNCQPTFHLQPLNMHAEGSMATFPGKVDVVFCFRFFFFYYDFMFTNSIKTVCTSYVNMNSGCRKAGRTRRHSMIDDLQSEKEI